MCIRDSMKKMLTMVLRMVARTPRMITLIPLMAHFVVHPSDELGTLLVANGLVATKKAELRLLFDTVVSAFHDHAGAPNGARWFCTFARTAVQGVETRMLQRLVTHNCTVLLSGMLEMSTSLTQLNSVVAAPNMPTTPDVYNAILMGTAAVRRRSDKHPRLETLLSKVCFRWGCTATYCTVAALIDVCKWPESPRHTAAFSAYVCDVFALLAADGQFIRHLHTGCPKSNTRKHRMSIAVYTMIGTAPARCLQEHVVAAARAVEPITLNTHCALLWRHLVRSIVDPSAMGGMQYTVEHALGEVALNRHWTSSDKTPADARSMWAWAVAHISNYHLVPAMLNFLDPKDISNRIIHSLLQHDIPLPARLFGPCKWTMLACGEFGNAGLRVQLAGTIGVSVPEMLADNEAGRTAALQCAQHLYLDKTISNHRKLHHFKILAACPHRQLFDPRLAFGMTHKCESWLHPAHHHKTAATVLAAYNRATATKTGILAHIPLEIVLMIVEMATAF